MDLIDISRSIEIQSQNSKKQSKTFLSSVHWALKQDRPHARGKKDVSLNSRTLE